MTPRRRVREDALYHTRKGGTAILLLGLLWGGVALAQSGPLAEPPAEPAQAAQARGVDPTSDFWPRVVTVLAGAAAGGLIGFLGSRFNQRAAAKRATTLALYEKFYSNELLAQRIKASRLILRDRRNLDALAEDGLIADYYDALNSVLHFFQQAESLREVAALDDALARRLLGRFIRFWHRHAYRQLAAGMDASSERWDLLQRFDAANTRLGEEPASRFAQPGPEAEPPSAGSGQPS